MPGVDWAATPFLDPCSGVHDESELPGSAEKYGRSYGVPIYLPPRPPPAFYRRERGASVASDGPSRGCECVYAAERAFP